MTDSKNVKIIETADGGIFILQRPEFLAEQKRAAVERATEKLSAEAKERRRAPARVTAAARS